MDLKNLHLIGTYLLLCLGTLGLWMGESDTVHPYPVVVVLCSIAAYIFTDRLRVMRLSRFVSDLFGLLIFATVVVEFFRDQSGFLESAGHFLVYLQVVKCFRVKRSSDFWMLYVLSVLQLAIACVVNRNLSFGLLLFSYGVVGIGTLTLFHLTRYHEALSELAEAPKRTTEATYPRFGASLAVQLGLLCLWSVPLTLVAFWSAPRVTFRRGRNPISQGAMLGSELVTGFSPSVRLDELTTIMESDDVVLNVWATDHLDEPVMLPADLLWRGITFNSYRDKEWRIGRRPPGRDRTLWPGDPTVEPGQVTLRIEQVVRTGETLFAPKPLHWARVTSRDGEAVFLPTEGRLKLAPRGAGFDRSTGEPITYHLVTEVGPQATRVDPDQPLPRPRMLDRTSRLPSGLDDLRELAARLTEGIAEDDARGKIIRIEDYLMRSGEFGYTLDIRVVDPAIDPIEDFLFNRKEGHCEYFASAMALLLRAAGVSTRVLNGFKGADYNQTGGYHQVRQLHAHSWVEAYIPESGQWVTLDPTPADERTRQVEMQRSGLQSARDLIDATKRLWYGYILGFDQSDQRLLVQNLVAQAKRLARSLTGASAATLRGLFSEMATLEFWLSLRGVITSLGLALAGAALFLLRSRVGRLLGALLSRLRWRASRSDRGFPLYRQWLRLLKRRRFVRRPSQTPREFAVQLRETWEQSEHSRPWSDLPVELAECFYAVRFGSRNPDPERVADLQRRIREFADLRPPLRGARRR